MKKQGYNKLKGYFAEKNIKHKEVADLIDVTVATFSKKINRNGSEFTADEIRTICKHYNISSDNFFLI